MKATDVQKALRKVATKKRAKTNTWFFKTEKGGYSEGDQFIGVTVPEQRKVAKQFRDLSRAEVKKLLVSKIHEHRLTALFILVGQFERTDAKEQRVIKDFYLKNLKHVNNWDLVDSSAHKILGAYLLDKKDRKILYKLAKSNNLWENRVAIITTWWFIRDGQLDDTYKLAEILLTHEHDLMHKAVGWMLREAGKRDEKRLKAFIKRHYKHFPRTALRYAIERFPAAERKRILKGTF